MNFITKCAGIGGIIGPLLFGFGIVSAQVDSLGIECNPRLFQELDTGKYDLKESLAIIYQVDENNFHELKRDASGNVTIPVEGVPVNFGATYKSFETTRNELHGKYASNYGKSEYEEWLHTRISGEYARCVEGYVKTHGGPGLYLTASDPTNTRAIAYEQLHG